MRIIIFFIIVFVSACEALDMGMKWIYERFQAKR